MAKLQDGTLVNIELQVRNEGDIGLFYWSRLYSKGIIKGEGYIELPRVIAVNIVNFGFPRSPQYHTCFHLWEDREKDLLLTDALEIHYINMVEWRKQRKKEKLGDPLDWWLAWLDKKNRPEMAAEAVKMDSGIAAAEARLEELLNDEDVMRLYEMRETAEIEWNSGIGHARREGIQEGRAEGLQEGRIEGRAEGLQEGLIKVAAKMRVMGDSVEKIQAVTGLSSDEIKKL